MKFGVNIFLKSLLVVIALQILNMSIDCSNANVKNDERKFNYVDTYVEYVAEVILNYENAIPETNKKTQQQLHNKPFHLICFTFNEAVLPLQFQNILSEIICNRPEEYAYKFFKEISPPPETC